MLRVVLLAAWPTELQVLGFIDDPRIALGLLLGGVLLCALLVLGRRLPIRMVRPSPLDAFAASDGAAPSQGAASDR